jgi:SAM-dependent methyltransferase
MVLRRLQEIFGAKRDIAILDAGCGTGGVLTALKRAGYSRLRGLDLSEHAILISRERGFDVEIGDIRNVGKRYAGKHRFDAVLMNDVVYFVPIAEWPAIFKTYREILHDDGVIMMNIPALGAFRGMHDRAVGITHRMSCAEVSRLYDPDDFECLSAEYWPFLLSPLIFLMRFVQRVQMALRSDVPIESDVDMPSPWLNRALLAVMRLESGLGFRWPWGSSLYVTLRKKRPAT